MNDTRRGISGKVAVVEDEASYRDLLADEALYASKHAGRDRVTVRTGRSAKRPSSP